MSTEHMNTSSEARDEQELTFPLGDERVLVVRVRLVASTPVVPSVPPRPRQPGDTLLDVTVDEQHVVSLFLGVEQLMGNTPVVGTPRPGGGQR